jgi:hypothetical protein
VDGKGHGKAVRPEREPSKCQGFNDGIGTRRAHANMQPKAFRGGPQRYAHMQICRRRRCESGGPSLTFGYTSLASSPQGLPRVLQNQVGESGWIQWSETEDGKDEEKTMQI